MAQTIAQIGEFALIERLRQVVEQEGVGLCGPGLGIGDDAAILGHSPGCEWLVTCDVSVEGRHYLPSCITSRQLGRRAMAVNLSDIAAMGGQPRYALVALGLRDEAQTLGLEELYRGFALELHPHGAALAGGNLSRVEGAEFIAVTLIGEAEAGRAVRRAAARVGDAILVTGHPGQAAAGLRLLREGGGSAGLEDHPLVRAYLAPMARVREGMAASRSGQVSAMIDTSDGFLGDLGRLCAASRVGALLQAERLPLSPALREAAHSWAEDPIELFLGPSDDYELILACEADRAEAVMAQIRGAGQAPVAWVGRLTDQAGRIELSLPDGTRRPLAASGWDHFGKGGESPW